VRNHFFFNFKVLKNLGLAQTDLGFAVTDTLGVGAKLLKTRKESQTSSVLVWIGISFSGSVYLL
jgi:hypothetical protein